MRDHTVPHTCGFHFDKKESLLTKNMNQYYSLRFDFIFDVMFDQTSKDPGLFSANDKTFAKKKV